jgi:predicted protein tyrosine phosphatase
MTTESELIVTDAYDAWDLVQKFPGKYRVISISRPGVSFAEISPYYEKEMREGAREVLFLLFDDAIGNLGSSPMGDIKLATREECQQALNFLQQGGDRLVHCRAGLSRSTGIVLGYLLSLYPYPEACEKLLEIRPCASPNSYVVHLMCQILGKEDVYPKILIYFADLRGQKKARWKTRH